MQPISRRSIWMLFCFTLGITSLSACSGPREATAPDEPERPAEEVDLSEHETFEPSTYPVAPPARVEIRHKVPQALMESRSGEGQAVTRQGFRIQVYSSADRREAEVAQQRIAHLWSVQQKEMWTEPGAILAEAFPDAAPRTYLVYRQPYYRLRIGNFASRAVAERVLAVVQDTYPNAFLVPATVTVQR